MDKTVIRALFLSETGVRESGDFIADLVGADVVYDRDINFGVVACSSISDDSESDSLSSSDGCFCQSSSSESCGKWTMRAKNG